MPQRSKAEGAFIAAKNAGRKEGMLFAGIDGLPNPGGGIKSVIDSCLSLTMIYPAGGREAIKSAYALPVESKEISKTVVLDTMAITADNAQEMYASFGGK